LRGFIRSQRERETMAKPNAKPKSEPESVSVSIALETTRDTPIYYANHAEVAAARHEFALAFARLPSKPSRAEVAELKAVGQLVWDTDIQIIIPPTLINGLIRALKMSKENYETMFGPINDDEKEQG
jgi:hypothetical protein